MSFDMSQFYQVFFEEAAEHLASMENLLLGLDVDTPDAEQLNAIFRAAHSIKGSAGTFGFTDLAEVTHVLENLLDRIRKGELPLRNDMIDAFLDAGDVLKTLLAAHRGEGAADPALVAQTCSRLNELTGGAADQASAHIAPTAVVCDSQLDAPTAFRITFDLDKGAIAGGLDFGAMASMQPRHAEFFRHHILFDLLRAIETNIARLP